MAHVTIVGAGVAGLSAALRLLERGVDVTIFEQDDFIGGKLGAHRHGPGAADRHEHSYHMYLNWYRNFWSIVEEVGVRANFAAYSSLFYLRPRRRGQPATLIRMRDVGAPDTAIENLFSGLRHPADMFLYSYSLLDLLATPAWRHSRLEETSVLAFMNSRGYNTGPAIAIQQDMLAKAFAVPSWLTSARSYQRFIGFGYHEPSPAVWLMRGNTADFLFAPLQRRLEKVAHDAKARLQIRLLHRVRRVKLDSLGAAQALLIDELPERPDADAGHHVLARARSWAKVGDALILAVPAKPLGELIDESVFKHAPALAEVRGLQSQPMASLDLYFKCKLPDIPDGITNLLGSAHGLSFLDVSQAWTLQASDGNTVLNVVASDAVAISEYRNKAIARMMIEELRRYLDFRDEDIDEHRTHLTKNVGEELFTNQVGSWRLRPNATCAISNLFLAGDFCQNPIDVVTIEGAVVSGLQAAEQVRRRLGIAQPIAVIQPPPLPDKALAVMKRAGEPFAYAAQTFSIAEHWFRESWRTMFPRLPG